MYYCPCLVSQSAQTSHALLPPVECAALGPYLPLHDLFALAHIIMADDTVIGHEIQVFDF
jgi:hypothetical protein